MWIGSLIASFLDLLPKKQYPPIALGVRVIIDGTVAANCGIQYLLQRR
mgnify:CR=1 FL=1